MSYFLSAPARYALLTALAAILAAPPARIVAQTFPPPDSMKDFSDTMIETPDTAMAFDPSDVPEIQPEPDYAGIPATVEPDLPDTGPINYEGPIGVTGVIDNVTTGCSYSPLSHSNLRAIDDIVVPGSVGKYPLKMTRYYNSRTWHWDYYRGLSPGWSHQYSWLLWTTGHKVISPQGNVSDFYCGKPVGVSEGWDDGIQGPHPNGGIWRLADGGRVHFSGGRGDWIEDPYGQRTTVTYDGQGRVWKVTEPGRRYLQFTYGTTNAYTDPAWGNKLLEWVEAYDGRGNRIERVHYTYTNVDSGGVNPLNGQHVIRKMLIGVAYDDNAAASYTYRTDNVPDSPTVPPYTFKFSPLLKSCNDKRYGGPMRQIFYEYQDGGPHGAILKEKQTANGPLVSRIEPNILVSPPGGTWMPNEFAETRGDGPTRTFTYTQFKIYGQNPQEPEPCLDVDNNVGAGRPPQQMLTDYTDFKGNGNNTHIGYDANWYVNSVRDANGNATQYERGNTPSQDGIGQIKKIIHPGGSYIQYGYQPETGALDGHYITSIRDENNHTTTITRDGNHRITWIEYPVDGNPPSHEEFSNFDIFGHPRTHRLRNLAYESFVYDGRGLLTHKYNPKFGGAPGGADPHTHYEYYTSGPWTDRVKKVTMPANWLGNIASESYEYDRKPDNTPCAGRGLVTKITHADNRYQSFKYDQWGNKWREWNELGEGTQYAYDGYNRVTTVTNTATNEIAAYTYNPPGGGSPYLHTTNNPDTGTAPTGIMTSNVYDENFRKTQTSVAGRTTWFHYDPVGNLQCVTDPRGSGECPSPLTACAYTTRTEYDTRNRKWHVWDAQNHRTTFTYDDASNVSYITRPDTSVEHKGYDAMNRVIWDIVPYRTGQNALNLVTLFEYNPSGTIHKVTLSSRDGTDPNPDHWTTFDYDASDRRKTMTYQNGQTQSWAYDDAHNMKSRTTVNGETLLIGYDNRNRKYGETWWDENAEWRFFGLDAASRLRRATNGIGLWWSNLFSDVHRDYDHAGRLTLDRQQILDQPNGPGLPTKDVNYVYDKTLRGTDGKPTRMYVTGAGYDYDFRYDGMGRFEKILPYNNQNISFQYYYDAASNEIERFNWRNRVAQNYTPDSLNRISYLEVKNTNTGTTLASETYGYDGMNRLRTITRLDNRQDQFYYYLDGELYVAFYGVTGTSGPDAGATPPAEDPEKETTVDDLLGLGTEPDYTQTYDRAVTYVYDKAGNRTWVADTGPGGNKAFTPNPINQYTAVTGSTITNGSEHEVSSYKAPTDPQPANYTYMRDEHLVKVTAGTNTYDLAYDAFGRCVKRNVNGLIKYYIYDGEKPILEYAANGGVIGKNTYGKGIDEILMRWDGTVQDPNLRTFYFQQDHEGSVIYLTYNPPTGTDVRLEKYRYDVFGAPTIMAPGGAGRQASIVSNRFLFTGREWSAMFGFYEYRARAYHPGLGRFMSEDPKLFVRRAGLGAAPADWTFAAHPDEGEFNLFRYCGNDPIDFTDPMGLEEVAITFRAFIEQANITNPFFSYRGDNRGFSSSANASSRVSVSVTVETDPSRNNGRVMVRTPHVEVSRTHNNNTGRESKSTGPMLPRVTASRDNNGNAAVNVQMSMRNPEQSVGAISSNINVSVNQAATNAAVNGRVSVSPSSEVNITNASGQTTNIPLQTGPQNSYLFGVGLLLEKRIDLPSVLLK